MNPFAALVLAIVWLRFLPAQALVLPPGPSIPGSTLTASLVPGGGVPLCVSGTSLFMLTSGGDLVLPRFYQGHINWSCSATIPIPVTLQIPAVGPGSSGSFVAYHHYPPGLAARLDVGQPSANFPAVHTLPEGIERGYGSHMPWSSLSAATSTWAFVNTSAAVHIFAPGDSIRVYTPGGTAPVLTFQLAGLTVPAGGKLGIPLLNPLAPAPYTVDVTWLDPLGGMVTRRIGVHGDSLSDLHLPGGNSLPIGGTVSAIVQFGSVATGPVVPGYALLVGFQPGSTPLPAGAILPLVPDTLVLASLSGGLAPFLANTPGTAVVMPAPGCVGYCGPGGSFVNLGATGIALSHPGPFLSGWVLRLAGLLASPSTGVWRATQLEELFLL
jgi:hypothetical protein